LIIICIALGIAAGNDITIVIWGGWAGFGAGSAKSVVIAIHIIGTAYGTISGNTAVKIGGSRTGKVAI